MLRCQALFTSRRPLHPAAGDRPGCTGSGASRDAFSLSQRERGACSTERPQGRTAHRLPLYQPRAGAAGWRPHVTWGLPPVRRLAPPLSGQVTGAEGQGVDRKWLFLALDVLLYTCLT